MRSFTRVAAIRWILPVPSLIVLALQPLPAASFDLFWSDADQSRIEGLELAGLGSGTVVDLVAAFGPAIYEPEGLTAGDTLLYWVDEAQQVIFRAGLDGSAPVELIDLRAALGPGTYGPDDIAIEDGFLY